MKWMVKRMKKLSYLFIAIAILLSDIMCFVVAYNYRDMLCGIEHAGYSAPAKGGEGPRRSLLLYRRLLWSFLLVGGVLCLICLNF